MQVTICMLHDGKILEIIIDNFKELTCFYGNANRTFKDDLSNLKIYDDTTYNFKGDTQVSLTGSKIGYIELSNS